MTDFIKQFSDPRLDDYARPALTRWGERRRIRQQLLELLNPPDAPEPSLTKEILDVLMSAIGEADPETRIRGHWVMSADWKQKIIDTAMWDKPQLTLYGLPVEVRADAGIPHLEVTG